MRTNPLDKEESGVPEQVCTVRNNCQFAVNSFVTEEGQTKKAHTVSRQSQGWLTFIGQINPNPLVALEGTAVPLTE